MSAAPRWTEHAKSASSYDNHEYETQHSGLGNPNDKRSPFEKDRDRIIYSAAFRRLQGKTQVFGMGGSDFFRTRLTHSLETAQIGKGIVIQVGNANMELVEAACLAHDIGHPPFGHTGEDVLKDLIRKHGGFEGNAQNLRLLTNLEVRSAKRGPGLNIIRATIDALLKYKIPYSKVDKTKPIESWKFYYDFDKESRDLVTWASHKAPSTEPKSFECQIMDWADDIAYSTHDLEDGIKIGMISESKITNRIEKNVRQHMCSDWDETIWGDVCHKIADASSGGTSAYEQKGKRRDLIASLINGFITSTKAKKRPGGPYPSRYQYMLDKDKRQEKLCKCLKSLAWELMINDEHVATLQRKATLIVKTLFCEFTKFDDKDRTREMYPLDFREKLDAAKNNEEKFRIACDFISGMTDNYAARLYTRITEGEGGSLMDII